MAARYQKTIGNWGEDFAADYLESLGYKLLGRNFHSRFGEIDLITRKQDMLVFVEVKTRTSDLFGPAEESITAHKLKALKDTISVYLDENSIESDEWQLDLLVLEKFDNHAEPTILHYQNLGD